MLTYMSTAQISVQLAITKPLDNTKNYIPDRNFEAEFRSMQSCLLLSPPCTRGRVVFQLQSVIFLNSTTPYSEIEPNVM